VLADIAAGTNSVLEWLYLTRVERPHRLPAGKRQRAVAKTRGAAYRDVEHIACGVIIELDGRVGHDLARDRG
jgi:hypothetical protein